MKKNLAILYGSRTCEHDVSIISALQAFHAADISKYEVRLVYIGRGGDWFMGDALKEIAFYNAFDEKKVTRVAPLGEGGKLVLIEYPEEKKKLFASGRSTVFSADVVMPVMHGMNGEDGTVQGMLELWNVPYTSSGVLGSAIGMDKITMRLLFGGCGLPVLPGVGISRSEWRKDPAAAIAKIEQAVEYPVYVKPANLGSSIGISRADDRKGLENALEVAAAFDRRLLIEKGVKKLKEVNCSVLGYGEDVRASALEMPVTWENFLSFDEKYMRSAKGGQSKGMQSLTRQIPAPIPDDMAEKIRDISIRAFRLLDCKGVVRIDYLIDEDANEVYIGEINTIPGSLAFYLWETVDVRFSEMLDQMVECALCAAAEKAESVFSYQSEILKKQTPTGKA